LNLPNIHTCSPPITSPPTIFRLPTLPFTTTARVYLSRDPNDQTTSRLCRSRRDRGGARRGEDQEQEAQGEGRRGRWGGEGEEKGEEGEEEEGQGCCGRGLDEAESTSVQESGFLLWLLFLLACFTISCPTY
jgi:hypothetical protein